MSESRNVFHAGDSFPSLFIVAVDLIGWQVILTYDLRKRLTHVFWIGGATDTGKSTVAQNLADRYGMYVYHYDKTNSEHHEKMAKTISEI